MLQVWAYGALFLLDEPNTIGLLRRGEREQSGIAGRRAPSSTNAIASSATQLPSSLRVAIRRAAAPADDRADGCRRVAAMERKLCSRSSATSIERHRDQARSSPSDRCGTCRWTLVELRIGKSTLPPRMQLRCPGLRLRPASRRSLTVACANRKNPAGLGSPRRACDSTRPAHIDKVKSEKPLRSRISHCSLHDRLFPDRTAPLAFHRDRKETEDQTGSA